MVLPTYNEVSRVARVIAYYRPLAPLVVVDNESTDGTRAVVEALGVPVVVHRNGGTIQTPEWFRHVARLVPTEHFVLLACSEFVPVALLERFEEVAHSAAADLVTCVRHSYTSGVLLPQVFPLDGRVERFFAKTGLDYDAIRIHGSFTARDRGREMHLPDDPRFTISHLRDADAASLMRKVTEYGVVEAQHMAARGKPPTGRWLFRRLRRGLWKTWRARKDRLLAREHWARLVMHTVIWWSHWEACEGKGLSWSRREGEAVWQHLVEQQRPYDPRPAPGRRP